MWKFGQVSQVYRKFSTSSMQFEKLRIAVIGQSQFGAEVYNLLKQKHSVVGVFTITDIQGRPDALAVAATNDGIPVFKFQRWRLKGKVLPEVLEQYKSVDANLNVLPFCTQFIPMDVINFPKLQSICYHPSILPRHRGGSAINWTLIEGDRKAGFSIFYADDGLDTGPILLQKQCTVEAADNVDRIYNRFLYPEGIKAMGEAVDMVADEIAPKIKQTEEGATYDPLCKKEIAKIPFQNNAWTIHNFIRGHDKVPGAWCVIDKEKVSLYGSSMWVGDPPTGEELIIQDLKNPAIVHSDGLAFQGIDDKWVNIKQMQFESGKMIKASNYGMEEDVVAIELTKEEKVFETTIREIWKGILSNDNIQSDSDFFKMGAGSMEVVRLVEEVRTRCNGITLANEDVYMATTFDEFVRAVVLRGRGGDTIVDVEYEGVELEANGMKLKFPNQLFINNKFVNSSDMATFKTINPTTEECISEIYKATKKDVDKAVEAARKAFEEGEWGKMNARDRGQIMYRLATIMEEQKEELATLESLDSGAVYTLALKTHIGMSIDTFRYFAGWCDKIEGTVIPINNARPNKNLTYTKREPIGVCGIITPWNYPLMMLSWKMAACLAAGNTVVLKPAQVTPLTSLKFCELAVKAGFPPGVINVLPGSGSVCGQAMADHPKIRKLGFTGSTPIGKTIMESCANSNLKKVSLELGGKSPLIIFDDCDMDKAVKNACSGVFFNKGENCIAAGRLFVEEKIHDEFVEKVIIEIKKMKIGDPLNRDTDHGPQNHKTHLDKLLEYCDIGVKEGATLAYGGKRVNKKGFFMEPTVFTDVEDHMLIAQEESFGPIMIISKFRESEKDDMIKRANNTEFALASGVFSKDINKALYVVDNIQAGTVFVNTYNKTDVASPFGGFKQSGFGKDLGKEALNEYLKTKAVTVEY